MVNAAKWHRELIANLAPKSLRLSETQVMRITRSATTDEAGMPRDEFPMLGIAQTDCFGRDGPPCRSRRITLGLRRILRSDGPGDRRSGRRDLHNAGVIKSREQKVESKLEPLGILPRERVLLRQCCLCPSGCFVSRGQSCKLREQLFA